MDDRLRERLLALPDKPGCYIMRDRRGRIIYVGKAVSLRRRVRGYFRTATGRDRADPKRRSLVHSVADIEWIVVRNEAEALLTEGDLIKRHKPRYNTVFRDDKRYLALRGDPREPWPRLAACRILRSDGARYFGPFPSADVVRTVLDFTERRYGLRRCIPIRPDAETYRHCHNDVIRFCTAPCAGRIGQADYAARFDEACAFLRGERPAAIEEVRADMEKSAAARDFERAARLRDTFFALREMLRRRARVVATPELRRADASRGLDELAACLELAGPPRTIEGFDVSHTVGTLTVASLVCAVDGLPDRRRYRRFRIRTVAGGDDPAAIAETVTRRYRRVLDEKGSLPDLVLVDGGSTQLAAARTALDGLGLDRVPCAGLAKQLETLVREGGRAPAALPPASAALRILQALRDEAHRFAIDYHRRLRNRRIRESALDEVPGIGPHRKQALLQAFGSVYRLARAAPDAVAAIPGIGPDLAAAVKRALGRESVSTCGSSGVMGQWRGGMPSRAHYERPVGSGAVRRFPHATGPLPSGREND
jgi:excinuclease ABC subunit C